MGNQYSVTINPTSYVSKTGTWNQHPTDVAWSELNLHEGYICSITSGVDTVASETIIYDFPSGYVGGTAYLNTMPWSNGGYVDVYVCKSSDNNDEIQTTRLNTYTPNPSYANNTHSYRDGVRVDAVAGAIPIPVTIVYEREGQTSSTDCCMPRR